MGMLTCSGTDATLREKFLPKALILLCVRPSLLFYKPFHIFTEKMNRYDKFRDSREACLHGLSVDSHSIVISSGVDSQLQNSLENRKTKTPDNIFGRDGTICISDLFMSQHSNKLSVKFPVDDNHSSSASSTSYQIMAPVFKPPTLKPSQQKVIAAMELMKKYNSLYNADLANNISENRKNNRKLLPKASSVPKLKASIKKKEVIIPNVTDKLDVGKTAAVLEEDSKIGIGSEVRFPALTKEDLLLPLNSSVSTNLPSQELLENSQSLASLHEIRGLPKSKSLSALAVKSLIFDDNITDEKLSSPGKDKAHNFLTPSSAAFKSPLVASPNASLLKNQFPGHGLKSNQNIYDRNKLSTSPNKEAEVNDPLQLRAVATSPSPRPSSRPTSAAAEPRNVATPADIFIPVNKSVSLAIDETEDEVEFSYVLAQDDIASKGLPQELQQLPVADDGSRMSSASPSVGSSQRTTSSGKPRKKIAYIIPAEIKNNVNASVSLDMSSVPKPDIEPNAAITHPRHLSPSNTQPKPRQQPQQQPQQHSYIKSTDTAMTDNISVGTEADISIHTGEEVSQLENDNTVTIEPMPYQVHKKMMGWKLTNPRRRRDLIGMLDIIHNKRPVDLLMGEPRIQNETLERRSQEYTGPLRRRINYRKIPPLKKLEQQIQYLKEYELQSNTYASAAPGSPLYYIEEVVETDDDLDPLDMNKATGEDITDHDLRVRMISPTAVRRQTRAWEQSVNRMLKVRRAYTSVATIRADMDEKKKRQAKIQELSASVSLPGFGGMKASHSALMDSIARFEKSTSAYSDEEEANEVTERSKTEGYTARSTNQARQWVAPTSNKGSLSWREPSLNPVGTIPFLMILIYPKLDALNWSSASTALQDALDLVAK